MDGRAGRFQCDIVFVNLPNLAKSWGGGACPSTGKLGGADPLFVRSSIVVGDSFLTRIQNRDARLYHWKSQNSEGLGVGMNLT